MKSTLTELSKNPKFSAFLSKISDSANYFMAAKGDAYSVELLIAEAYKQGYLQALENLHTQEKKK